MPKKGGGGDPAGGNFDLSIFGPPPGDLTAAKELWVDLGLIPTGEAYWFGMGLYGAPDKSFVFELRTNDLTKSLGTDADTSVLSKASSSPKKGQTAKDMYRKGRLHTATVVGTGVEHYWLKILSKKNTPGAYLYQLTYTTE